MIYLILLIMWMILGGLSSWLYYKCFKEAVNLLDFIASLFFGFPLLLVVGGIVLLLKIGGRSKIFLDWLASIQVFKP